MPATHGVHDVAPAVVEYVPAMHGRHVAADEAPAMVEEEPTGQRTHVLLVAPDAERYEPATHGVQVDWPAVAA